MFSGIVSDDGSILVLALNVTVSGAGQFDGFTVAFGFTVYDESIVFRMVDNGLKQ
ncbi:hypothetical protein II582_03585 [bacterium]|nr:hypothetical protein [bacterium]